MIRRLSESFTSLGRLSKGTSLRFLGMSISGGISAVVLLLMASQRLDWIPSATVVSLLLFIQWQTLALTVAKIGIDQMIFAVETRDPSVRFDIRQFVFRRSLWLALPVSCAIGWLFSPFAACVAFISVLLDVYSLAASAELNARKEFGATIVANFLNYPLFLMLAFFFSSSGADERMFLFAFGVSSFVRYLWVRWCNRRSSQQSLVTFASTSKLATQQVLNYILFRADQLLLPIIGVTFSLSLMDQEYFVFMFRFPELMSAGMLIVGIFVYPGLQARLFWTSERLRVRLKRPEWLLVVLISASMCVAFAVYLFLWQERALSKVVWGLPFLVHALLVLPANAVTYLALSQGLLKTLIRNLTISLLGVLVVVFVILLSGDGRFLTWIVPVQLGTFLLTSYLLPHGRIDTAYISPLLTTSSAAQANASVAFGKEPEWRA